MMALAHEEPDRVPFDYWAEKKVTTRLMQELNLAEYERLLEHLQIDMRYTEGTRYVGPELQKWHDGTWEDIWGIIRKPVFVDEMDPMKGSYEHVTTNPLAFVETVQQVENYRWPSPDWYEYTIDEEARSVRQYAVVCGGDRLNRTAQFKPAMYLRGMEQMMVDLVLNPVIVEAMIDHITNYYLEYDERIFQKANGSIDIFYMGDDFGTQNGLLMSVDMWRKYFKKGFKRFIDLSHRHGVKVMHHTCGGVFELIPEFIDCGLDILQSLQPRAKGMDFNKIKKEYGKYLAFQGGVDIQGVMPFGTTEDVKAEVKRVIETLGPGGGYILCTSHNIQLDTPSENILALYDAAQEFASYRKGAS